tara:strand:- start:862 stop:1320 length:459 start_codon:yes stop_codon:yes gene_type:complete
MQRDKSIQGLRLFKDTLPTKIKKNIAKKGEIFSKTLDNWKYLVGEKLFKVCYPKLYKKSNLRGKTLVVMVKHGSEIDLEYSRQEIINKINFYFGYEVLENILIKSFNDQNVVIIKKNLRNVTKSKFSNKISSIKNDKLRKTLKNFEKAFKSK